MIVLAWKGTEEYKEKKRKKVHWGEGEMVGKGGKGGNIIKEI